MPFHTAEPGAASGRQRRHGLNPAASAVAALGKERIFMLSGRRARQTGRQSMHVEVTAVKISPS